MVIPRVGRSTNTQSTEPLRDIRPGTLEIFLPIMLKRQVAFCGLNKRYSIPTPSPRYPSQRLASFKLFLRRTLLLPFLHFMSVENPPPKRRWSTYNLVKDRSGTGTPGIHITDPILSPSVRSPLFIDYVDYDSPSLTHP